MRYFVQLLNASLPPSPSRFTDPPRCSSPPADAASPRLPSPLLLVSSGCRCSSDPCQGLQVISGLESQGVELKFVGRRCLLWFW
ncbi:hypothetical protein ACOSQ2_001819 [Xanthoceras sorbifolium]